MYPFHIPNIVKRYINLFHIPTNTTSLFLNLGIRFMSNIISRTSSITRRDVQITSVVCSLRVVAGI